MENIKVPKPVYINNTKVSFTDTDYVAAGGEATVWRKGKTAYRLFLPNKQIDEHKIDKLLVFKDSSIIIGPQEKIYNAKKKLSGTTMKFVENTLQLPALFPKKFKLRHNLSPDHILKLVMDMCEVVQAIHTKDILLVDTNPMNFLLDKRNMDCIYFIDVLGYEVPGYPATAIAPTIRDWHCTHNLWSQETDWYSLAILFCQIWTGMHPFQGKHQNYQQKSGETAVDIMKRRMIDNISIFNPHASVPPNVDFTVIPPAFKEWFIAEFEEGKRTFPPDEVFLNVVLTPTTKQQMQSSQFTIRPYKKGTSEIIYYYGKTGTVKQADEADLYYTWEWEMNELLKFKRIQILEGNELEAIHSPFSLRHEYPRFDDIMEDRGHLYIRAGEKLYELECQFMGKFLYILAHELESVFPNTTQFYPGVALTDALGTKFAIIFPHTQESYRLKIPITGTIINARYENRVLVIIYTENNTLYRSIFRIAKDFLSLEHWQEKEVHDTDISFTVLDKGSCVLLDSPEKLLTFNHNPGIGKSKLIEDPLFVDISLFHEKDTAILGKEGILYTFTMR